MTEISDSHFQTLLNAVENGDALPTHIPSDDAADLELAGRLLHMKAEPSPRLVIAIERITSQPSPVAAKRKFTFSKPAQRIALSVAFACALLLVAAILYPPTRQAMAQAIDTITFGMITVIIEENQPTEAVNPEEVFESYGAVWIPGNLEEIQTDHPQLATLPAFIPEGYVLQERVGFFLQGTYSEEPLFVIYQWKNAQGDWIELEVNDSSCPEGYSSFGKDSCGGHLYISSESPIFVNIHDQQGVLQPRMLLDDFSGKINRWNARRYRVYETGFSLYWEHDKSLYILRVTSDDISQDELIRIAESIP
jgi:hypothetical protein